MAAALGPARPRALPHSISRAGTPPGSPAPAPSARAAFQIRLKVLARTQTVLPQRGQQGEARASQLAAPLRAAAVVVLAPHRQGSLGPLGRIVIHRHLRMLHEHTQPRPMPPQALQNLLLFRPQLAAGQFPVHPLLDLLDLLAHALIHGTAGRAGPLEPGLASPGVAPKQLVNQLHPPVGPTLPPVGALDRVDKVPALMRPAIRQLQGPVWPQ